jgi:hypothetical protein
MRTNLDNKLVFVQHLTEVNNESIHHNTSKLAHKSNVPHTSRKASAILCPYHKGYMCNQASCRTSKYLKLEMRT